MADRTADVWVTPDYQIIETSLEVTAYLTAED
ncbi:pyrroloquinoline quinone precursor peptide PqqA [Spirillospora sp. CA-255316]